MGKRGNRPGIASRHPVSSGMPARTSRPGPSVTPVREPVGPAAPPTLPAPFPTASMPASMPAPMPAPVLSRRAALASLALAAIAAPPLAAPALARRLVGREPFTIGVLAPGVLPESAREATASRLERAVARPVRLRRFGGAARLVDAAAGGRIDLAVHTALSYASTAGLCDCSTPILRPVASDGTAGLRAVLIVRERGPNGLDALPGASPGDETAGDGSRNDGSRNIDAGEIDAAILGAAPGTVAGEVVRRGVAADAGRALRFAGDSPDAALSRFMAGGGAALAGHERVGVNGNTLGGTLARLGPGHRVLWRSRPVWHGPLALSARAAPLSDRVTGALIALTPGSAALAGLGLGRVKGFAAARSADYAPLVALLRA